MTEKLDAGRAMNRIAGILNEWLSNLDIPTETALKNISQAIEEWREDDAQ